MIWILPPSSDLIPSKAAFLHWAGLDHRETSKAERQYKHCSVLSFPPPHLYSGLSTEAQARTGEIYQNCPFSSKLLRNWESYSEECASFLQRLSYLWTKSKPWNYVASFIKNQLNNRINNNRSFLSLNAHEMYYSWICVMFCPILYYFKCYIVLHYKFYLNWDSCFKS